MDKAALVRQVTAGEGELLDLSVHRPARPQLTREEHEAIHDLQAELAAVLVDGPLQLCGPRASAVGW